MSRSWLLIGMVLLVFPGVSTPAPAQARSDDEPVLGFSADLGDDQTRITELRQKPETFDSLAERLDFIHDNLHLSLQRHVEKLDMLLDDGSLNRVPTPPSRFRLSSYFVLKRDPGFAFSLEPHFDMEVDFPNLEKRLKVFLESSRSDELPGIDPSEREQNTQVGVRSEWLRFRTDVGIKTRWLPELFARVEWRPEWSYKNTLFQPRQRAYYESGDGLGSLTSLTVHRWFGAHRSQYWQSVSAMKYSTKGTDGMELEQTVKLGWVRQVLENKWSWKRVIGADDIARGATLRYSVFAHINSETERVDRHRITYTYRRPLYKHWIYLEVAPGLETRSERDWAIDPIITMGVDMLFWGTYER